MKNLNYYAITAKKIFNGTDFLENVAIIILNEKIHDICHLDNLADYKDENILANLEVIDFANNMIVPGFIDLQINGCGGVLFNDSITESTLEVMEKTNLAFGCTSFLPTLITTEEEEIKKAVEVVKSFHKKKPNKVLGIHIEGPYISKLKKGIHNPSYMKPINEEMVDLLIEAAKNMVVKITMAPEENNLTHIKKLTDNKVIVSIGHSNATYTQAIDGIVNGITIATHLFNAMSAFEGRSPGVVGAVFNSSDVYAGIIVDGHHVSYNSIAIAKKIKQDKLFIVTDAVTTMGTTIDQFQFADQTIYVHEGKCVNKDGTLAGANIDMLSSLKNSVEKVGISLPESLKMVSTYPANAIKVHNKFGKISKGFIANIVVLSEDYEIIEVIAEGQIVEKVIPTE